MVSQGARPALPKLARSATSIFLAKPSTSNRSAQFRRESFGLAREAGRLTLAHQLLITRQEFPRQPQLRLSLGGFALASGAAAGRQQNIKVQRAQPELAHARLSFSDQFKVRLANAFGFLQLAAA